MSMAVETCPVPGESAPAAAEGKQKKPARQKKNRYPQKRTMNLYYKPDRTTKPATIALYVLFVLVCLLGLGKFLVYDLWVETTQAQQALAAAEAEQDFVMRKLKNYGEVRERYQRYSATDEERELLDRMEILALLDDTVGAMAEINTISISANAVQIQFSGVTLAQVAEIVRKLEASPLVAHITVSTAATQEGEALNYESAPVQANAMIQLQKGAEEK